MSLGENLCSYHMYIEGKEAKFEVWLSAMLYTFPGLAKEYWSWCRLLVIVISDF
jgi:hypothetical protein